MSFLRETDAEPIPGYKLIEPLGSGGFGEVWKCIAPGGLYKAIKFVYGNLNTLDAEGVRAEQELHALERIKEVRHPFVLSMERIENIEGELVIVMELADKSLYDAYVEYQAAGLVGIPRDSLLRYLRDAAEALDHMMEKYKLLHLDVKPRNLFLISDRVKVADFGLVKHIERQSASGVVGGVTPLYQPPETIHNKITPFSDQYSLAIVYQELLTGQRPFNGKNARQLALQHLNDEPELRALPEAERPIVRRAPAKDPTKRWPNCLSFIRALYAARHARLEVPVEETTPAPNRPKTLADTMEDFLLEGGAPADLATAPTPPPPAKIIPGPVEEVEVSQLGITVAQPATGALRPTLLIGIGHFGRRALLELRCRFLDRFGDLDRIPLIRFLYVDADAEAIKASTRGSPEVALSENAVYHLQLQSVGNYRKRMLEHLNEWLPREKLYAMPRSLQTQGIRALGRLAFSDNHLRFLTRLRREIQQATHPDTLYKSVSQTGLALRENLPRVYVMAAAGGGGSGMLVDLGFALRRTFTQCRFPEAEVIACLLCGSPNDPATPPEEQANIYACLTELNHFTDPNIPFAASYGPDAPRVQDEGKPFASTYLLQLAHRTPENLRDAIAHLGSYVFHDVTTPLGLRLDRGRHTRVAEGATVFRSFGTYAVWFPRGLLLRLASRQACVRLIDHWHSTHGTVDDELIESTVRATGQVSELQFETICAHIEETARLPSEGGSPDEALSNFLARIEEQSQLPVAQDDPASWAGHAMVRIQEWVGGNPVEEAQVGAKHSRVARAFANSLPPLLKSWDNDLTKVAVGLLEPQGARLAAGEATLRRLQRLCTDLAAGPKKQIAEQSRTSQQAWEQLVAACESCQGGPGAFSFFGGRSRRQIRAFVEALTAYCRQRLEELLLTTGAQFFHLLAGRLEERLREFGFCRQRLRHLQDSLSAPPEEDDVLTHGRFGLEVSAASNTPTPSAQTYWEVIRESRTVTLILPDGGTDLEEAAQRFLEQLKPEQWSELDRNLYDHVLIPMGGLHQVCVGSGDLLRNLAEPLVSQAIATLEAILPVTDVANVELSAGAAEGTDIQSRARDNFVRAAPLVSEREGANQQSFLLVPASDAGKALGDDVKAALPGVQIVRVPGQADLMFCREQGNISFDELQRLLKTFRPAYEESIHNPAVSPHARFDITDWVPLDP